MSKHYTLLAIIVCVTIIAACAPQQPPKTQFDRRAMAYQNNCAGVNQNMQNGVNSNMQNCANQNMQNNSANQQTVGGIYPALNQNGAQALNQSQANQGQLNSAVQRPQANIMDTVNKAQNEVNCLAQINKMGLLGTIKSVDIVTTYLRNNSGGLPTIGEAKTIVPNYDKTVQIADETTNSPVSLSWDNESKTLSIKREAKLSDGTVDARESDFVLNETDKTNPCQLVYVSKSQKNSDEANARGLDIGGDKMSLIVSPNGDPTSLDMVWNLNADITATGKFNINLLSSNTASPVNLNTANPVNLNTASPVNLNTANPVNSTSAAPSTSTTPVNSTPAVPTTTSSEVPQNI